MIDPYEGDDDPDGRDDDGDLLDEFTVVNPKLKAQGRLQLWGLNPYGAYPIRVIVEGRIAARGMIAWNDCTPKEWLDIDTSDGVAPEFHGQGWGTALYLGAALAADALGYKGVVSHANNRKPDSDAVWVRLRAAGLTVMVENEEGYRHDALSAAIVRKHSLAF